MSLKVCYYLLKNVYECKIGTFWLQISSSVEGNSVGHLRSYFLGKERTISSDGITVEVSGTPQVLRYRTDETVWFPKNSEANLDAVFCSNPKYKRVYWEWGVLPNIVQMSEG